MAEIEAIEVCKPVLGNIKIGAYDSANDIYLEACKELNLTCDSAKRQRRLQCLSDVKKECFRENWYYRQSQKNQGRNRKNFR
jgi:hypothetical protein